MTRPFVDSPPSEPKLYLCSFCNSWQWTDQGHACLERWSVPRMLIVASTLGACVWLVVVFGVVRWWRG